MPEKHRICVCVCTFKRPRLLASLLKAVDMQETDGLFEYEIIVVDNDRAGSGQQVVTSQAERLKTPIHYFIEPEQNIARARNKAVSNAHGDIVAIIDDDEVPNSQWLLNMYKALVFFETAGVLGPVLPRYEATPPAWVIKGGFFERPRYYSGYYLSWWLTRTGNCLLKRDIFKGSGEWFLPKFGSGGEDRDFFKRMIHRGHVFVWCDEAPLLESVPAERWSKKIMLKRALLRGKMTYESRRQRASDPLASLAAILAYSVGMPLLFALSPVFGFNVFMQYVIKEFDHLGKLFALFGINPVTERYII